MTAVAKPTVVIRPKAASRLIRVAKRWGPEAKVRRIGSWKSKDDQYLWYSFLFQIMVPGDSRCVDRMTAAGDHRKLSYARLCRLSATQQKALIYALFRAHRVRWAGKKQTTCRKSAAVVYNLRVMRDAGGPSEYLKRITGKNRSLPPIAQITADFKYIKLKGSQDLAADLGLSKDAIALDIRVLGILKAAGVKLPAGVKTNPRTYAAVCAALLRQVCAPAKIEGYRFDRALYQFYPQILDSLKKSS